MRNDLPLMLYPLKLRNYQQMMINIVCILYFSLCFSYRSNYKDLQSHMYTPIFYWLYHVVNTLAFLHLYHCMQYSHVPLTLFTSWWPTQCLQIIHMNMAKKIKLQTGKYAVRSTFQPFCQTYWICKSAKFDYFRGSSSSFTYQNFRPIQ